MEQEAKKAILIVGKMGYEKFNFIKMLTTPEQAQQMDAKIKGRITPKENVTLEKAKQMEVEEQEMNFPETFKGLIRKLTGSEQTQQTKAKEQNNPETKQARKGEIKGKIHDKIDKTSKCQAYPMDSTKIKQFQLETDLKDVYVIDTPNFCLEEQALEVVTKINEFIVAYTFEIICILYTFSDSDQAFNKDGHSFYQILHEKLVVSKGIKNNVSYYIFITFDSLDLIHYSENLKKVQEKSKKVGLHFKEILLWVNENHEIYKERIKNQEGCNIQEPNPEQWQNLGKFLKKGEKLWRPKKAILVVGKMGHGKSSFIKMWTTKQEKQEVGVGEGTTNQTSKCQAYRIDSAKIKQIGLTTNPEDLFLIDTPGLDSQQKSYLIQTMIDEFILYNRFQIISIFYIFNPNGSIRTFDKQGKSFYHDLHKKIILPKKIKDNISHYIFTEYDNFYTQKTKYQKIVEDLKQQAQRIGVPYWKEIPWVSEPINDRETYESLLLGEGAPWIQKSFDNQERQLGKFMKEGEEIWKGYSHDQLVKLYHQFQELEFKKISKMLKDTGSNKKDLKSLVWIQMDFKVKEKWSIFQRKKQGTKKSLLQRFIDFLLGNGLDSNVTQNFKDLNDQRLIQKTKNYYLSELSSKLTTNSNFSLWQRSLSLRIKKEDWIKKISIKGLSLSQSSDKLYWECKIKQSGTYEISCQVQIPSVDDLRRIEDESKLEMYYT